MTEKEIAQTLLPLIGGKENIVSVMHCATRLRIVAFIQMFLSGFAQSWAMLPGGGQESSKHI